MAVYVWKGVNASGKDVKGVRDADNPRALRAQLRRDGVMVTEVMEEAAAKARSSREIDLGRLFRRVSAFDVAMMTRQLATLLRAGIPLVEALSALIDQLEHPDLKSAVTQTRNKVNEGTSLADALKAHPKLFSNLYTSMVSAGEASGTLEVVLARLADFLESQSKLKSKLTGALAYPVVISVIGVILLIIMMVGIVPKVAAIYEDFDQALPWYTQVVIGISNLVQNFWWLLAIAAVAGIWIFRRWKASDKGQKRWDLWILSSPLLGKVVVMTATARFARTLATLLSSGVAVLSAMQITRNVLVNTELMRVIDEARGSVREGESIATPLKRSGRFPPIVTHMIAIGERSGQLEEMLEHIASSYEHQVDNRLTAMTSIVEPVMIVMLGAVVGFVVFSILMPLVKINEMV